MFVHRRTLLKASALGVGGLAATAAAPSGLLPQARAADLPWLDFGPEIEGYARYEGQTQCLGVEQPGVVAFRSLVMAAFPGSRNISILRACGVGGTSEHKEGRAWDWGVYATRPNEAAMAEELLDWLLATDRHGNRHAHARRLGIMYIIWNRRRWASWSPDGWSAYTGSNPHTDHIHFSFGWPGARKETSFWSGAGRLGSTEPTWSPWTWTADATTSAPAAVSWSAERHDVFAVDGGRLQHRWYIGGDGLGPGTGWQDLGAPPGRALTSQPAATSRGEGRLDVFVRADDWGLWQRSYTPDTGWIEWIPLGGICYSAPGATSWGPDHVGVSVIGRDGSLWERQWNGDDWSRWTAIPASPVTTGPALATSGTGRMDLFARGRDQDLVHNVYRDGRWQGWTSLGGRLAHATPAATSTEPGNLDVFVVGADHGVYRKRHRAGSWLPSSKTWDRLGGRVKNGLAATSRHADHVEVFAQSPDGRLYQRWES